MRHVSIVVALLSPGVAMPALAQSGPPSGWAVVAGDSVELEWFATIWSSESVVGVDTLRATEWSDDFGPPTYTEITAAPGQIVAFVFEREPDRVLALEMEGAEILRELDMTGGLTVPVGFGSRTYTIGAVWPEGDAQSRLTIVLEE